MRNVYCPHCLELVSVEGTEADPAAQRCPVCDRCLDPSVHEEPAADYAVHTPAERAHQSAEVREYVQSLEQQARRELSRQPYIAAASRWTLWRACS